MLVANHVPIGFWGRVSASIRAGDEAEKENGGQRRVFIRPAGKDQRKQPGHPEPTVGLITAEFHHVVELEQGRDPGHYEEQGQPDAAQPDRDQDDRDGDGANDDSRAYGTGQGQPRVKSGGPRPKRRSRAANSRSAR